MDLRQTIDARLLMPIYCVYSLQLQSPFPLQRIALADAPVNGAPDMALSFLDTDETLPDWATASWTAVREITGYNWSLSLSTPTAGSDAALRLQTRRQTEETVVIFGCNAARIVVQSRLQPLDCVGFWQEISSWIFGSVLGFAMCVRRATLLHGSVVAINGRAVGLLGVSGAGKSTLAAAFVAAGHAVLADDHLVAAPHGQGYWALPGPPQLRLWPTSLPVLDAEADAPAFWVDVEGKHHLAPARDAYCSVPLPLAAIYILAPRDPARADVAIDKLSPAAALNGLMNQRFCATPLWPTYATETLAALSSLAQQTPVHLLYRPNGLDTLPSIVDAIHWDIVAHER